MQKTKQRLEPSIGGSKADQGRAVGIVLRSKHGHLVLLHFIVVCCDPGILPGNYTPKFIDGAPLAQDMI